jgi:ATP-dependent DNA helicase DinG
VFTSATLATAGDFSFFRRRLGIGDGAVELALPAGFDYPRQALLYVPDSLPDPREPGFVDAVADEVVRLLEASRGRAFVLFTSHANLRACHARVVGRVPWRLLVQGTRPRDALLQQFREDTHSVLFATASFWEGVDVAGESLSCVVIDKLPFGSPDDPLLQARLEALTERGGEPFHDFQVPAAVIALRQGFGRLIRTRSDRGIVALLDRRLHTKGYGRRFLAALPDCERTTDFARVRRWADENLV